MAWTAAVMACLHPVVADLDIRFDYRYDTRGFFSGANLGRRQILEEAASVFERRIRSTPPAISPGGINTWTLSFPNPGTGAPVALEDLAVSAGTMTVFVGARPLEQNLLGLADYNYTYFGNPAWVRLFSGKDDVSNFSPFGGSISFNLNAPWYFDFTPDTRDSFPDHYDFYSVAIQEIAILLGFNSGARAFEHLSPFGEFLGPRSQSLYGGPVPLAPDWAHWREDVSFFGEWVAMAPILSFDQRRRFTDLDFAALADIGYILDPWPTSPLRFTSILNEGGQVILNWTGGTAPYRVQVRSGLGDSPWLDVGPAGSEQSLTVPASSAMDFFRVLDARE